MTALLSTSNANFQNKISTSTLGADIVSGVTVEDITVYVGLGTVKSQGIFMGGVNGITDDNVTHKENAEGQHYLAGINLKFSKVFIALQIDKYAQSAYSAKLGTRF